MYDCFSINKRVSINRTSLHLNHVNRTYLMRCEAQHLCKALDTLQDLPTIEDPPPPLCTNEAKDTLEDPLNYFF
jgi:hypothetical protein